MRFGALPWRSRSAHMNESWYRYEWVMVHICISRDAHMNEPWCTYVKESWHTSGVMAMRLTVRKDVSSPLFATHCDTLQHTATHLQHTATHYRVVRKSRRRYRAWHVNSRQTSLNYWAHCRKNNEYLQDNSDATYSAPCSVLQCVAVCCSVWQCVAVCGSVMQEKGCEICLLPCRVLQCVAVCCSVLQCVAVCCSVLKFAAACCSVF